MKWPSHSSDLNRTENAWAVLKKRICERPGYPTSADYLFSILNDEWSAIPSEYFNSLIRSMKTRVCIAKENEGRSAKY